MSVEILTILGAGVSGIATLVLGVANGPARAHPTESDCGGARQGRLQLLSAFRSMSRKS